MEKSNCCNIVHSLLVTAIVLCALMFIVACPLALKSNISGQIVIQETGLWHGLTVLFYADWESLVYLENARFSYIIILCMGVCSIEKMGCQMVPQSNVIKLSWVSLFEYLNESRNAEQSL